jgi:hypothetical protein
LGRCKCQLEGMLDRLKMAVLRLFAFAHIIVS